MTSHPLPCCSRQPIVVGRHSVEEEVVFWFVIITEDQQQPQGVIIVPPSPVPVFNMQPNNSDTHANRFHTLRGQIARIPPAPQISVMPCTAAGPCAQHA